MARKKYNCQSEPKTMVGVRLKESVRIALRDAADKDDRTANSLAKKIITDWLKAGGHLK